MENCLTLGPGVQVFPIDDSLRLSAAERIVGEKVGGGASARVTAARRFIDNAADLGIDLSLMWGTVARGGPRVVRQACLAVVGAGRTATLFVSGGGRDPVSHAERVACLDACCEHLGEPGPKTGPGIRLAQALLEQTESAALSAFLGAGFSQLGNLAYMRRALPRRPEIDVPAMPSDVEIRCIAEMSPRERDDALIAALERSYVKTLDCPELSGLRDTADVLESHVAVGRFDPSLWFLAYDAAGEPAGCVLLSPCPEQDTVELVYLGIGETLRGRGIGSSLLWMGLNRVAGRRERTVTCAVDTRNAPALRLYRRAGFEQFAVRVPVIRPLTVPRGSGGAGARVHAAP